MAPLARHAFALFTVAAAGCADVTPATPVLPGRDFSVAVGDLAEAAPSDLSASISDLGVVVPGDLALADLAVADQATHDLRSAADLAVAVDAAAADMTPIGGSCDLGGAPSRLVFAGVANGNALYSAEFTVGGGWSPLALTGSPTADDVALALVRGQPLVVVRQTDSTAAYAFYDPCANHYPALTSLGMMTLNRPSVVGGAVADAVFRGFTGGDQRLYHAHAESGSFAAPTTQSNFLTTLAPSTVRYGGGVHALFAGTDTHVYDGTVLDTAGGGSATTVASSTATTLAPSAVTGSDGTLYVVWTSTDTNLLWTSRAPSGAYDANGPYQLCRNQSGCLIDSNYAPSLALGADGAPVAAWVGISNGFVYTSTLQLSPSPSPAPTWGAAQQATTENTTLSPMLATGIGGAEAELVYVSDSDGHARHVRLGNSGCAGASPCWSSSTEVTGTNFLTTPALISQP